MDSRGSSSRRRHGLTRPSAPEPRPAPPSEESTATAHPGHTEPSQAALQVLFTPEEGAELLRIRASWLRRKAAARVIPCRFVGKHLRFARSDLETIAGLDGIQSRGSPPQ